MTIKEALSKAGLPYSKAAARLGIGKSTFSNMVCHGQYPVNREEGLRAMTEELIRAAGIRGSIEWPAAGVRLDRKGLGFERRNGHKPADPREQERQEEIRLMQINRDVLQLFGLRRNPFLNDVEDDADVFRFRGYERVEREIHEAVKQAAMIAVVSESGAGKTTIWDGVAGELATRSDVRLCTPKILSRERMKPDHLTDALLYGLMGEGGKIPHSVEARGRLAHTLLSEAKRNGVTPVLYIDDAHFCDRTTMRLLKSFYELKAGRFRLLAIVLVGLPELQHKLAVFPEVGNRIRLVEVPAVPVEQYLEFKLKRVGSQTGNLFGADGLKAFCDRFRPAKGRPAVGRPLEINAACIRAMFKLHENGGQAGERISAEIVDQLPGGAARRF